MAYKGAVAQDIDVRKRHRGGVFSWILEADICFEGNGVLGSLDYRQSVDLRLETIQTASRYRCAKLPISLRAQDYGIAVNPR